MPNFSKFLDDYSVVKTSITAADGHIYYTPYFDGFDDIERMFIFRADWVRRLLDEDAAFDTDREVDTYYKPYLSESYEIDVKAVTADGGGVQTIKKKAKANIVTTQNNLEVKNGETLTTALRAHIDAVYGDTYKNRSDLFIGQDAAYDADEMVALFRCVLANTRLLTGQSERPAVPFYPRWYQAGRVHDLLGLSMAFGVRGHESKMGRLYLDKDGVLKDISLEPQYYDLIERLHWMYKEGLILKDFHISGATDGLQGGDHRARLNNENLGFATYDYNQTTTVFNSLEDVYPGFDLRPVLPPVANWDGEWHQFTSSWRSVKSDGWAILKSIEADPDKLYRALMLFDYMFSPEGGRLMSYGPEEWIDGTLKYNGKDIPRLSAAALKELNELAGGNYTNYYRRWLGGTFPIGYVKEQGQEYQVVHPKGRVGLDYILRACELGTMHHLRLNATEDTPPQETMLPTTFRVTLAEERRIREELTDFQTLWRAGSNDTDRYVYLDYILAGFSEDADNPIIGTPFPRYEIPMRTKAGLLDFVANERNGKLYLEIYADAYKRMTEEEQSNPP
jgi:putative aldouronate transport system substrate-binding protein